MSKQKVFGLLIILALSAFTLAVFAGGKIQYVKSALRTETRWTGNPLIPGKGVCDPAVRIFSGKFYLFATHDTPMDAPQRKGYKGFYMTDWWVWSSTNLADWHLESKLKPDIFGMKGITDCWATDGLFKNGKCFWYVCTPESTYVAVSNSPKGPWASPLGNKPLMAGRDPALFMDDDGTAYLITGVWTYNIARLKDNLISLAGKPRSIKIINPRGPYNHNGDNTKESTDDKPYLNKRDGWYYLSWGCYYAMSRNIYGPYICKGSFLREKDIDPKLLQEPWDKDRHGSFFEWKRQWYFICNDRKLSKGMPFRNCVISYVKYKKNGEIEPIKITVKGVRVVSTPDAYTTPVK